MDIIQVLWLLLGVLIGLVISQGIGRSNEAQPLLAEVESLRSQLHETELAYQMAVQMSQFKGSFLARTSHELRSPLNGVIGVHQLILSDLCDNAAEERTFLAQAHTSTLKMIELLDWVIDAAKLEQGNTQLDYQPIPLAALLNDVYNLTHLQAQNRNLQLQFVPLDRDLVAQADLRRLRQTLISLVDAAISQMQEGTITVSVPTVEASHCEISIATPLTVEQWTADLTQLPGQINQTLASLAKATVSQLAQQPFPSSGFAILVARSLLQSINGQLEIITVNDAQSTRINCRISLMQLDASVN